MMGATMIRALSDDAAYRAAQEAREPLIPWPNDDVRGAPFLGDYVPAGWRALTWPEVKVKPRNASIPWSAPREIRPRQVLTGSAYFMVDGSGMGAPDESALTFEQLTRYLADLFRTDKRDIGIGIIEAGQFQVVMQLYVRDGSAGTPEPEAPEGWCDYCQSSAECYCETCDDCGANLTNEEDHAGTCRVTLEAEAQRPVRGWGDTFGWPPA